MDELRKLEIKAGISILLLGAITFVVSILTLKGFVFFIELLSDYKFIQIAILSFIFTLLIMAPFRFISMLKIKETK